MTASLEVGDLTVELSNGWRPVDRVALSVRAGETLALVGESGCGKTLTALAIMGLLPSGAHLVSGQVHLAGSVVSGSSDREMTRWRGTAMAMIPQDPLTALNPVLPVGWQIAEMFAVHRGASRSTARKRAMELLERVGIPDPTRSYRKFPHQFSGGMRQRALIAVAIALEPRVLIADEPTTALDTTVQAQILELLSDLRRDRDMAMLLITHDLGVVAALADNVVLMYAGRVVEWASVFDFFKGPRHPYGQALLESVPRVGDSAAVRPIVGSPPRLSDLPSGCRFHPRCPYAAPECRVETPELRPLASSLVACHRAEVVGG